MADFGTASSVTRPVSGRNVTAVLGPTNTGKTHLAIERMLGHQSGLIGLPLRLLAREVYDKIVARIGARDVALITGEEKIKPDNPRFYVCTVEAMPRDVEVDFLAVDEIQLAADTERGHVFTERMFNARGQSETLLLGAATMQDTIRDILPGANFISRPRLSKLTYVGQKKITRLPRRSAIVAFSATEVYEIAELIRRQRGGAAVVLGALSPRTRNAQVALYQSGDVDFLVATDAIGMGLNLDVDHVAFAGVRKFDGRTHRHLSAGELGQIAGRAGRYMNEGTFGVTGDVEPLAQDMVDKLENHNFDPIKVLQWRNGKLDFASLEHLQESLRQNPNLPRLTRARSADDVLALVAASRDDDVRRFVQSPAAVRLLWDACQIPDYRKISSANHAELVSSVYKFIMSKEGVIPEDWFASQVAFSDRTDGDIDTLSTRIAHIRTWKFVSQKREWLAHPDEWQARTSEIEDALSDALHERLTQRFVDRRTSVLMKSLRDSDTLYADIESDGKIMVETHFVGRLDGFRFTPDSATGGVHGKAARTAAVKILTSELANRAEKLTQAADDALALNRRGMITWSGHIIAQLDASDDPLKPTITLLCDENLQNNDKLRVLQKLNEWLTRYIEIRLKPLIDLSSAEDVTGLARGIAFRLKENFGILRREGVAEEIRTLDQEARSQLRKYGVRFGAHNIYFPLLLKPSAADLLLLLWALKHGAANGLDVRQMPEGPRQGLTSTHADPATPEAVYKAMGFQICGPRAVRIDMLERLADIIRPLISWKPTESQPNPPAGATGRGAFKVQPDMMSIMGCSADVLGGVLTSLGFQKERRVIPTSSSAVTATDGGVAAAHGEMEPALPAASDANPEIAENAAPASTEEAAPVAAHPGEAPAGTEATAWEKPEATVEYEEIWRVKRARPDHRQGAPGGRQNARRFNNDRPATGETDTSREQMPREPGARPPRAPFDRNAPRESRVNAAPGDQQAASRPPHQRRDRRPNPRVAEGASPAGGDARAPSAPPENSRPSNFKPNRNAPPQQAKKPQQMRVISSAPKDAVNSDSPFAALLQLKERLEQGAPEPR